MGSASGGGGGGGGIKRKQAPGTLDPHSSSSSQPQPPPPAARLVVSDELGLLKGGCAVCVGVWRVRGVLRRECSRRGGEEDLQTTGASFNQPPSMLTCAHTPILTCMQWWRCQRGRPGQRRPWHRRGA